MKTAKMLGLAAGFMLIGTPALAQPAGEIGYTKGSLGYDALMAGDNEIALRQLETAQNIDANDPARLINLGQAYARTGRTADAARMFLAAINNDQSFDLVLADGAIMNSRNAAAQALSNLNRRIAAR